MPIDATFEKLVFGGEAIGWADGKTIFAWNVLPGEKATIAITNTKKQVIKGVASTIHTPSKSRIEPTEGHYLSCSPWQIMTTTMEHDAKIAIALEAYQKIGGLPADLQLAMTSDDHPYGYRNKMEFSFIANEAGIVSLAFFQRGAFNRYEPLTACALAHPTINTAAQFVLEWINASRININYLKTLVIRSNGAGTVVVGLFTEGTLTISAPPDVPSWITGFFVYKAKPRSPASIPERIVWSSGSEELVTTVLGTPMSYHVLGFFQVNVPMFEAVLTDIRNFLLPGMPVLDFYAGVGGISIPLHTSIHSCTLVDCVDDAIAHAKANIERVGLNNYSASLNLAEHMTEAIVPEATVILDPPRAGLHAAVIERILTVKPKRVIYLSCNVSTHARDIQLLRSEYALSALQLYNFFPRTPHIEALAILDHA